LGRGDGTPAIRQAVADWDSMNQSRPEALSPALRLVLFAASVVVIVAGLRLAATLLVPLALALFVTMVSLPLLLRLVARGVPVGLAAAIVLTIDMALVLGFVSLLVRSLAQAGAVMPAYYEQLGARGAALLQWLAEHGIEPRPYLESLPTDQVIGFAQSLLRGATDAAATAFLVVLISVFLLLEATIIPGKLRRALGPGGEEHLWLATVMTDVQHYLVLKTLVSAGTGLMIGVAAWVIGVDFALLWGLLAFLLNFIPNVGSIIAAVPAVLVALLQLGVGPAMALAAVYLTVNMVVGNLLEPSLMGRRLGLSPLVVILSLVFWGWVWGAIGMFLAVPLAMVARIVLDHTSDYRWVAVLMGGEPALPSEGNG
jgi:AI-2 transport protein TqsA